MRISPSHRFADELTLPNGGFEIDGLLRASMLVALARLPPQRYVDLWFAIVAAVCVVLILR
jgi:hypothetical protein